MVKSTIHPREGMPCFPVRSSQPPCQLWSSTYIPRGYHREKLARHQSTLESLFLALTLTGNKVRFRNHTTTLSLKQGKVSKPYHHFKPQTRYGFETIPSLRASNKVRFRNHTITSSLKQGMVSKPYLSKGSVLSKQGKVSKPYQGTKVLKPYKVRFRKHTCEPSKQGVVSNT